MEFASTTTYLVGAITMLVYLGKCWMAFTMRIGFIVFDAMLSYNTLFRRSTLNPNRMCHSTYHQIMKFLMPHGIRVVKGDQHVAHNFYVHSMKHHVLKSKENLVHAN